MSHGFFFGLTGDHMHDAVALVRILGPISKEGVVTQFNKRQGSREDAEQGIEVALSQNAIKIDERGALTV